MIKWNLESIVTISPIKIFPHFPQKIIKEVGKSDLDEIKVTSDIAETSVKEFKTVVQKLQTSLKREKQLQTLKAINEKNKSVSVQYNQRSCHVPITTLFHLILETNWKCWLVRTVAVTTNYQ